MARLFLRQKLRSVAYLPAKQWCFIAEKNYSAVEK